MLEPGSAWLGRFGEWKPTLDASGVPTWPSRADVRVWYSSEAGDEARRFGQLTVGFGAGTDGNHHGVELALGSALGGLYAEPVLLLKVAYGGKSLHTDFRPPAASGETGAYYIKMIESFRAALRELALLGVQPSVEGMFWWEGWNDLDRVDGYEDLLVQLVQGVRVEMGVDTLPVVVGGTGNGWGMLPEAQEAATLRPEMGTRARFVRTADFLFEAADSPHPTHLHHWYGNALSYMLTGEAMGLQMLSLLGVGDSPPLAPPALPPPMPSPPPAPPPSQLPSAPPSSLDVLCIPDDSKCADDGAEGTTCCTNDEEPRACTDGWIPIYTNQGCSLFFLIFNQFTCYNPACNDIPEDTCGPNSAGCPTEEEEEDSNSVCIPDASKCDSSFGNDCGTAADTSLEKRKCRDGYIAIYTGFSCGNNPPCNFFTCYPPSCDNLPEDKCGPNECNTDTSDAIGIGIIILIVVVAVITLAVVIGVLLCRKKGCCCFARQQQKGPVMTSAEQVAAA